MLFFLVHTANHAREKGGGGAKARMSIPSCLSKVNGPAPATQEDPFDVTSAPRVAQAPPSGTSQTYTPHQHIEPLASREILLQSNGSNGVDATRDHTVPLLLVDDNVSLVAFRILTDHFALHPP